MSLQSPWLTVKESAAYCRCSSSTLLREARRGTRLVGYKLAGRRSWRFAVRDLDNFVTSQSAVVPYRTDPTEKKARDGGR